jgi:hypothetical protein
MLNPTYFAGTVLLDGFQGETSRNGNQKLEAARKQRQIHRQTA